MVKEALANDMCISLNEVCLTIWGEILVTTSHPYFSARKMYVSVSRQGTEQLAARISSPQFKAQLL